MRAAGCRLFDVERAALVAGAGARCGGARVGVAAVVVVSRGDVYRAPLCAGGDVEHRHGRGCLPLLVRALPSAPTGWRWQYGNGNGWAIWLERVGGAGARWYVVGLPPVDTAGQLVTLVNAFVAGHRGVLDGPN